VGFANHILLKAESPKDLVPQFFDKTAYTYDKVVNLTTFGKDKYWKKEILKKIPNCNSILDLACGTGILTFQIAEKFPDSKIVGGISGKRGGGCVEDKSVRDRINDKVRACRELNLITGRRSQRISVRLPAKCDA